ncbi:MAG: glycosyltransferase family 4 protein [Candidatus Moraniibacteriota bacterium]|nr:MAG: glycosyltransferase family 4 protein [Candidatus Moranbacteria bacterium]
MKIAIVSPVMVPVPPKKYGGIERIVDELARGLAQKGHEVTLFCCGGSTLKQEGITRVETSPYPTDEHREENRRWELDQIATVLRRQHEFDCIHFHYEPIVFRFFLEGNTINFLDFFTVPLVVTFHNTTHIQAHEEYYRKTLSLYRHEMVYISENQRQPLAFFPHTQVIYNAIPIEKFPFEAKKEEYLLFLGRITPFKGILEAIFVAKKTKIPLIIVAKVDPVDKDFFEKEVKKEIDGKYVQYVGEANFFEKTEYLKKAKCLLFPILWEEPFGLVMIEALACGTPVVAFRRGSVSEIIQDTINGFIVDTVDQMVEAVKKIEIISTKKCRETIEKRFSIDRMVCEYENLFKRIGLK